MNFPTLSRFARWTVLGLLVSAIGGLGLVALASAHERPADGPACGHGMPPMRGLGGGMGGMPMGGWMLDHLLAEVKATDAQRNQIHQIAEGLRQDGQVQAEAAAADHERMMALFTAPTVDAQAAEALREQIAARRDEASKHRLVAMVQMANVLTAAQRQQIAERMNRLHAHLAQMHRPGRRPQGPAAAASGGAQ